MNLSQRILKIAKELSDKQIWQKAYRADKSIMKDPRTTTLRDKHNNTPLHILAEKEVIEILKHPQVSKVKDNWGHTPLHSLAIQGNKAVLKHKDADKVKNNKGHTPKDILENIAKYWKLH